MAELYHVMITDLLNDDLEPERGVLDGLARVTALQARSERELLGRIEQADALIVYHELSLTALTIPRLERANSSSGEAWASTTWTTNWRASAASLWPTCPTTVPKKWRIPRWVCCWR